MNTIKCQVFLKLEFHKSQNFFLGGYPEIQEYTDGKIHCLCLKYMLCYT